MFSMARLWRTYQLELRLLVWHWSFLLLLALYVLLLLNNRVDGYTAEMMFQRGLLAGVVPMIGLGALMLGGLGAARADRAQMDLIEDTLPTSVEQPLARWLAVMTLMVLFLVPAIGLALSMGPINEGLLRALPTFLVEAILPLAIMSILVWLLYWLVGNRRWLFPFLVIIWLGMSIGPGILSSNFTNLIGETPWMILYSIPVSGFNYEGHSQIWGRTLLGNLTTVTSLSYVALLILLVALVVLIAFKRRFYRWSVPVLVVCGLSAVGLVVGTVAYDKEARKPFIQFDNEGAINKMYGPDAWQLPADVPYTISDYAITLDYSDPSLPAYTVQATLVNRGTQTLDEVVLSLNNQLTIESVSLPYDRQEHYLTLALPDSLAPQAALPLELHYSGNIWWYSSVAMGRPTPVDYFTTPTGANLACDIAWYPIPGLINVGREFALPERQTPDCLLDTPAAFDVSVQGGEAITWSSNLPQVDAQHYAGDATWVQLIAAEDMVVDQIGSVRFITPPSREEMTRQTVEAVYLPALQTMQHFYPDVEALNVWAIDDYTSWEKATPLTGGWLTVQTSPFYLDAFDTSPLNAFHFGMRPMIASLFGQIEAFSMSLRDVGYFLEVYRLEAGDPDAMATLLEEGIPQGEGGRRFYTSLTQQERYPVAFALMEAYQAGGEERLQAILDTLRADFDQFDKMAPEMPEAMAQWIHDYAD